MADWLISTHSGLWRADENGECRLISRGYYYGIATYSQKFAAARRLHARTKDSPTIIEWYDEKDFIREAEPEIDGHPIIDVHQIAPDKYGRLWMCDGQEQRLWRWSAEDGLNYLQFAGGELLNSVQPAGDLLWLVFHNRGARPSVAFKIDPTQEEHFQPIDLTYNGVHNILPRGSMLYFNASDDGAVCRRHPTGLIEPLELGSEWHTKGMTLDDDDHLVVGTSEREVDLDGRFSSESCLAVIDLDKWRLIEHIRLLTADGSYIGNVNEIRRLPG